MTGRPPRCNDQVVLSTAQLDELIRTLEAQGFEVMGPTVRGGAIVYDRVSSIQELPVGWTDEQDGGEYRLKQRADAALFGYAVGPHSWKKFLFPPVVRLWKAQRRNGTFQILLEEHQPSKRAFLGIRACELAGLARLDQVFLQGPYVDPVYQSHRSGLFIIAVNCVQPGGTCFCASMGTGPKATTGYDLSLTEVLESGRQRFIVHVGTEAGARILAELECAPATDAEIAVAERLVQDASGHMGRTLDVTGIKELFLRNTESPRWDALAERCLSCANCTLVCPTCFCSTVEDVTDLSGQNAERVRKWDCCFTTDFSYIHGSSVRATPRAKYRQWITHKLAYWHDQFGCSGCVGCGRCITWCPVGIDITQEARAFREAETAPLLRAKEGE